MLNLPKNTSQMHAGFEIGVPISERMLVTPIEITPAYKAGESVNPYAGTWKALWDTGAQSSTISTRLATELGLPSIGERQMTGAGGPFVAKEYLAGLLLPNKVAIHSISLYGFVGSADFDLLIGMDIISLGDFLVSTHADVMHFSFQIPSVGGIRLQNIQKAICTDGRLVMKNNTVTRVDPKVGRNDPCPCKSGKKYKHCHGKESTTTP